MKTIETPRCTLRAWRPEDAADVYAYARSSRVGPMAGWKPHESLEESQKFVRMFQAEDETWALVHRQTGRVIGSIGLHKDSKRDLGPERARMLGYVLAEDFWGQGFMLECCNAVLDFAFRELNLELVSIFHFPWNRQSRRVIEKLGFSYEGTLHQSCRIYDGSMEDEVCYVLTRTGYLARSLPDLGQIRPMVPEDWEAVAALSAQWESEAITYGFSSNALADLKNVQAWIALWDGHLAGYLLARSYRSTGMCSVMLPDSPCLEIEELYVAPAYRRHGLGKRMFQAMRDAARQEGISFLTLTAANRDNHPLLRLYQQELGMTLWSARLFQPLS